MGWPDRVLSSGAVLLLAFVLAALTRGHAELSHVNPIILFHLATIVMVLVLTPIMLLSPRGTTRHRRLGWIWCIAMVATAAASLFIRLIHPGHFSPIHALSIFTLLQVPLIIRSARRHAIAAHRRSVRLMVLGALLIAGFFTFPFGRLLGRFLFGA